MFIVGALTINLFRRMDDVTWILFSADQPNTQKCNRTVQHTVFGEHISQVSGLSRAFLSVSILEETYRPIK